MGNRIKRCTILGLAAMVTTTLAACDGDGPTAPQTPHTGWQASMHASRTQGPRPLRGRVSGAAAPGDPCSATPPGILVTARAEGTVTHLGAVVLQQAACVSVPDFLHLGPSFASLTAANGDRLDGVMTSLVLRPEGFDMGINVTGGSGRFADAGGEYLVQVTQEAPLQPFSATIEGWVWY